MLKFNLTEDESLCDALNIFISALLPHENFDSSLFSTTLETVFKYIHLDEFQLEYRLIFDALCDLGKIKSSITHFEPQLTKETFSRILEAGIMDAIVRSELGIIDWLSYEGMNTNLNIPTVREEACQKICTRALQLYDTCYEMRIPSNEVINHEPELRAAFMGHVGTQCVNLQSQIIRHEVKIGRHKYHGFSDWLKYASTMTTEITDRLSEADSQQVVHLDSVNDSLKMLHSLQELLVPITNYGIPELDDVTPILRHRLVVVVGRENIGKTKFVVDESSNVIIAGGKVLYMCGESVKAAVYADILINYIHKVYGVVLRPEHLADPSICPDDIQKIIGMSLERIVQSGALTLCDAFNYGTVYSELEQLYERYQFDMVVIDHSCALVGTAGDGSLRSKIETLAIACRDFKKKYPVCVMVTSHPSVASKETAKKNKLTDDSPTRGSQTLSAEADEVLYLRDTEMLAKQDLILLENTKRRNAGRVVEPIVLRKYFAVSSFIYDPALQSGYSREELDRNQALSMLDAELNNSSDDDIFSLKEGLDET